jgi:hypothetical protein
MKGDLVQETKKLELGLVERRDENDELRLKDKSKTTKSTQTKQHM